MIAGCRAPFRKEHPMTDNLQSNDIDVWQESNPTKEVSAYPETSDTVPTTVQSRKKRLSEQAEDYPHVIAQLNPTWRVILCRDGIQWIVQHRTGNRWRSSSYCRTREGLLRCIWGVLQSNSPDALSIINSLPDIIK